MFEPQSRYANVPDAVFTVESDDGSTRMIRYKRRRIIAATDGAVLAEHIVKDGDRLDVLAARYLGDPTQFWRICDANLVLSPAELTETLGRRIRITMPSL